MDKDIEKIVKSCKKCALAMKAPLIKVSNWPATNKLWTRLHADFAGPMNGLYCLIIIDSFTKWLKVLKCKRPTSIITFKFLHGLSARFGCPETIVTDYAHS